MNKARSFYYWLLLAQLFVSLHQWIPHSHEPAKKAENTHFWTFLQNLISTDLGEAHLENIRPNQAKEEEKAISFATKPNKKAINKTFLPAQFSAVAVFYLVFNYQPSHFIFIKYNFNPAIPCWRLDYLAAIVRSPRAPPVFV
jgi:hypothetical protein